MTTNYSRNKVVYSGGDTIFSISFSYIKESYVEVYINGVQTTNFEFLTKQSIRINASLTSGDVILIKRNTQIDDKLVTFSDTSILKKDVQNLAQDQVFDAVQETVDNNEQFKVDTDKVIDDFKTEVNTSLSAKDGVINAFKTEINGQIAGFIDISETISADYVNIQAAVAACSSSATTATNKANEAIVSANALTGAVNNVTTNTTAIGTLSSLTTTNKSNLVSAINEVKHTHTNKTVLDSIMNSGDGKSFLANDGSYKEVSGGVSVLNPLGALTSNASPLAGKINTATFSGVPNITLPTITDNTKEATVILDFTSSTTGSVMFANGVINKKDGKTLTYSTLAGIRNRVICKTIDSGTTWEVELKIFGGVETTYVPAVLSADDSLGGSTESVYASSVYSGFSAYRAGDNNLTTYFMGLINNYYTRDCVKAVKASSVTIKNSNYDYNLYSIAGYALYGSNDNSNFSILASGTNSVYTSNGIWDISILEANRNFYRYYKLYCTSSPGGTYWQIGEFTPNGVYIAAS